MEMQASRTLAVTQQQAWEALNDPEVLKLCIPGCDKVEASGENQYAVAMALKIGPVSAKFAGKITLADIVPPESYTIAFDGSGGVAGLARAPPRCGWNQLPADASGLPLCELHYTVHATVGGKIAQLGQRLIDGAAKTMAEDFSNVLTTKCSAATPGGGRRRNPGHGDVARPTQPIALPADSQASAACRCGAGLPSARRLAVVAWLMS